MGILVEKIPAYAPGTGSRIIEWVLRSKAREYVEQNSAQWVNRCKAIRFFRHDDQPVVDDASCRMGPRVSEAAIDGERWAREILRKWNPKTRSLPQLVSA